MPINNFCFQIHLRGKTGDCLLQVLLLEQQVWQLGCFSVSEAWEMYSWIQTQDYPEEQYIDLNM